MLYPAELKRKKQVAMNLLFVNRIGKFSNQLIERFKKIHELATVVPVSLLENSNVQMRFKCCN